MAAALQYVLTGAAANVEETVAERAGVRQGGERRLGPANLPGRRASIDGVEVLGPAGSNGAGRGGAAVVTHGRSGGRRS